MNSNSKIFIAGHKGMVGSSTMKLLLKYGFNNLLGLSSTDLDLRNQDHVYKFLKKEKPDAIINAAAMVGGILANNNNPYEFLMNNLLIQNNLIKFSYDLNIKKFIFLGSSCIYPKFSKQPIKEEYLLSDYLEPTNQWYAIAKIAGVKLIESLKDHHKMDYISLMPTNLYGPFDNFNLETSHVLPAMIRRFHEAKTKKKSSVTLWGDGKPKREFLHVNDLSEAIFFSLNNKLEDHIYNIGSGVEISIKNLAELIKKIVEYEGKIIWDESKPNGTPRKLLDSSKFKNLGWKQKIDLKSGIINTYTWFLNNNKNIKE